MSRSFETHSNVVVLKRPIETQAARVAPERSLWSTFCAYYTRAHDRRYLAELNDHALRDIGLTRAQIEQPFWRPLKQS